MPKTRAVIGDSGWPIPFFVCSRMRATWRLGIAKSTPGLSFLGIRSDTREQPIDSAGTEEGVYRSDIQDRPPAHWGRVDSY
jgi:hypothetical protein